MRHLLFGLLLTGGSLALAEEPAIAADDAPVPAPGLAEAERSTATMDRLELETSVVTGSRELPKVMYVVPWKRADLGRLGGKPLNSLVDEVLTPVDRDVFEREIGYFRALDPPAETGAETPVTAGSGSP